MAGVENRTDAALLVLAPRWGARYCWLSARLQYRVTAARYIEMTRSGMLRIAADRVELADAGQLNRPAPDLEGTLRRLRRRAGSQLTIDELFHQHHVRIAQEARSTRSVLCRAGFGSWAPGGVVVGAASSWIDPPAAAQARRLLTASADSLDSSSEQVGAVAELAIVRAMLRATSMGDGGGSGVPGGGMPGFTGVGT